MPTARKGPGLRRKASLWSVAALILAVHFLARAESGNQEKSAPQDSRRLSSRFPDKPSIAPSWSIPVEPLGFVAPGQNFLGMRVTMVSLDFLGEDRLLFTFRVPGLMHREPRNTSEDQRQIRAVVIALPSGTVRSETNWTLHDRLPYLWVLDDDHFLLRDYDTIFEGDASLNRKPLLHFPGPILSLELNPGRQYIVTSSREPAQTASAAGSSPTTLANPRAGSAASDSTAQPDLVLRILRRDSHQVMLVERTRTPVQIPLNSDGYISALRGNGAEWMIDLNYFTGQSRILSQVKSACAPDLDFLSESEALVTACSDSGDNALAAIDTSGSTLWTDLENDRVVWPLTKTGRNGLRFARETLYVTHSISAFDPLGTDDIKGQWVRIFDAATGNVAFESPATPILDAGGNVAISPSGRRVAVLNAGAVQVFELPPPPALQNPAAANPPR